MPRPKAEPLGPRKFSVEFQDKSFVGFCRALGFNLHPGQEELARVAFDGGKPKGDLGRVLFGPIEEDIKPIARRTVCLVCGARGGKTRMASYRALHLALTVPIDKLGPGEIGYVLLMAPTLDMTEQLINYVMGAVEEGHGAIVAKHDRFEEIEVHRADGVVIIKCIPADAKGASGRGKSLLGAVLDEIAFIPDSRYKRNDADIYKAVSPRLIKGGQIVLCSTPWSDSGILFEFYQANYGKPQFALVAHAPTIILNPDKRDEIEIERMVDADNARREFDAEFGSGEVTHYFSRAMLDGMRTEDTERPMPFREKLPYARYAAVGDIGLKRDASTLVIVEYDGEKYRAAAALEMRPQPGRPLVFSVVMDAYVSLMRRYGLTQLGVDQYHREACRDYMAQHGIAVYDIQGGPSYNVEVAGRLRRLAGDGRLEVNTAEMKDGAPDPGAKGVGSRILQQLGEIRFKQTSGGQIQLEIVRRGGTHGDLAMAYMGAVFRLWHSQVKHEGQEPSEFSDEWYAKKVKAEEDRARRAALEKPKEGGDEWGDGWGDKW